MKIKSLIKRSRPLQLGFSIVEVLVAMAVIGILFVSLYAGFLSGFQVIHLSRENLRATQILVEKMETVRLYTWDQITSNGFIPSSFIAYYYPTDTNTSMRYSGTVNVGAAPTDTSYSTNMRQVTVQVVWTNSNVRRTREMTTFVSRYGMQNYIY